MIMEICPLAVHWGSLAEFVGALGSVVVGSLLVFIGIQTNQVAKSANQTSEKLVDLEFSRVSEDGRLRDVERQLLYIELAHPMLLCYSMLHAINVEFAAHMENRILDDQNFFLSQSNAFEMGLFRIPDSARSRLHYFDDHIAARFLQIEGATRVGANMLKIISRGRGDDGAEQLVGNFVALCMRQEGEARDLFSACRKYVEMAGIDFPMPAFAAGSES